MIRVLGQIKTPLKAVERGGVYYKTRRNEQTSSRVGGFLSISLSLYLWHYIFVRDKVCQKNMQDSMQKVGRPKVAPLSLGFFDYREPSVCPNRDNPLLSPSKIYII